MTVVFHAHSRSCMFADVPDGQSPWTYLMGISPLGALLKHLDKSAGGQPGILLMSWMYTQPGHSNGFPAHLLLPSICVLLCAEKLFCHKNNVSFIGFILPLAHWSWGNEAVDAAAALVGPICRGPCSRLLPALCMHMWASAGPMQSQLLRVLHVIKPFIPSLLNTSPKQE